MKINPIVHLVKANPIQTQSNPICQGVKLMQSVYLQRIMKKNADRSYEKTKPIQTQTKPISNAKKGSGEMLRWASIIFLTLWISPIRAVEPLPRCILRIGSGASLPPAKHLKNRSYVTLQLSPYRKAKLVWTTGSSSISSCAVQKFSSPQRRRKGNDNQ